MQPAAVTLGPGYTTVGTVLKELSAVERRGYRTTPKWENQPIFVNFPGTPAPEVRAQLARLLYGEYNDSEGVSVLRESPKPSGPNAKWVSAIDGTLRAESAELVKEGLLTVESVQAWKAKRDQEDAERVRRGDNAQISAEDQLLVRPPVSAGRHAVIPLLLKIGASKLSEMPFGTRAVYSTQPNSAQRMFPTGSAPILYRFLQDQATVRQVLGGTEENPVAFASSGFSTFFGQVSTQFQGDVKNPGLGLLSIYRSQNLNGFVCEISIADRKGRGIGDAVHFVPTRIGEVLEPGWDTPAPSEEVRQAALVFGRGVGSNLPLRRSLSKVTTADGEEATLMISGFGQGLGESAPTALRERLLREEPWKLLLEPTLTALSKGKTAAILLPDSSLRSVSRALLSPKSFAKSLVSDPDLEVTNTANGFEIRPSSASVLAEGTVDRAELAELLQRTVANEAPPLDALARFASGRSGMRGTAAFAAGVLQAVSPLVSPAASPFGFDGQRMLRAWLTLGPQNQAALRKTGRIDANALNAVQIRAFSEFFLHSVSHPVPLIDAELGIASDMNGAVSPVIEKERTLLAPRGVGPTGFLALSVRSQTAYLGVDSRTGKRAFGGPDIFRFGSGTEDGFFPQLEPDRLFPAEQSQLMFTVVANSKCAQTALLEDFKLAGAAVRFEELPAKFRAEVADVRARPRFSAKGWGTINP